jgi:hypothetical protein
LSRPLILVRAGALQAGGPQPSLFSTIGNRASGTGRPLKAAYAPERPQLRCPCRVTPWGEFVEAGGSAVCDLAEYPCKPGLRINLVQLGGLDQGNGYRHGFAATERPQPKITGKKSGLKRTRFAHRL